MIMEQDYPECFGFLIEIFEAMWNRAPKQTDIRRVTEIDRKRGELNEMQVKNLREQCEAYKIEAEAFYEPVYRAPLWHFCREIAERH
jgi:hypothetical protein